MTLREAIQAKIDEANSQAAALNIEMQNNQELFADWVDQEPQAVKAKIEAFMAEIAKHIG
jgi:hypothetical protein